MILVICIFLTETSGSTQRYEEGETSEQSGLSKDETSERFGGETSEQRKDKAFEGLRGETFKQTEDDITERIERKRARTCMVW